MIRKSISVSCWTLLGLISIAGLVWAQDSVADIEFLEFLANWSEEEQYWLDAELDRELDALADGDCHSDKRGQTGVVDGEPCSAMAIEEEDAQ